jgi:hypothetical protein
VEFGLRGQFGIEYHGNPRGRGRNLLEQIEPFAADLFVVVGSIALAAGIYEIDRREKSSYGGEALGVVGTALARGLEVEPHAVDAGPPTA